MAPTPAYETLNQFLRRNYASMYAVALKLVHTHETAQDIVQDVVVKYWQRRDTDAVQSESDYLFIMVRNASLNYLRSRKREQERYGHMDAPEEDDIFRVLVEEELHRLLMAAIDKLPEQTSRVMRLALSGLDNKEIAQLLGISVNTVKTLKYGAIRKLKVYFSDV